MIYKSPVDFSQPGVSEAQFEVDNKDCHSQAMSAVYRYQGQHPLLALGAVGAVADAAAVGDDQRDQDANLASQPGGTMKFVDLCMKRKGYKLLN
jgi:hypothetical protein